jgi:hypothetical protein
VVFVVLKVIGLVVKFALIAAVLGFLVGSWDACCAGPPNANSRTQTCAPPGFTCRRGHGMAAP